MTYDTNNILKYKKENSDTCDWFEKKNQTVLNLRYTFVQRCIE